MLDRCPNFYYRAEDVPSQGRGQIYGLYLPEDILKQVYQGNAQRLLAAQ